MLAHSDSWHPPRTAKHAYRIETVPEIGGLIFLRLVDSRRHIIGHLVIPSSATEPDDGPGRLAEQAAARLAELLAARQQSTEDQAARSRQLTAELITGDAPQRLSAAEELIAERLLSTSESYCAVALGVDPRDATPIDHEKTAQSVSRTLDFVRETSTATVVGGILGDQTGVLVFPRPVVVPRLTRILTHPQITPVRAGVGPLTSLAEVHRSFERAHLAWRAAWLAPTDHDLVTTWEEVGLDGTLARMPVENFSLADLPPVTRDLLQTVDSPDLLDTDRKSNV